MSLTVVRELTTEIRVCEHTGNTAPVNLPSAGAVIAPTTIIQMRMAVWRNRELLIGERLDCCRECVGPFPYKTKGRGGEKEVRMRMGNNK